MLTLRFIYGRLIYAIWSLRRHYAATPADIVWRTAMPVCFHAAMPLFDELRRLHYAITELRRLFYSHSFITMHMTS